MTYKNSQRISQNRAWYQAWVSSLNAKTTLICPNNAASGAWHTRDTKKKKSESEKERKWGSEWEKECGGREPRWKRGSSQLFRMSARASADVPSSYLWAIPLSQPVPLLVQRESILAEKKLRDFVVHSSLEVTVHISNHSTLQTECDRLRQTSLNAPTLGTLCSVLVVS